MKLNISPKIDLKDVIPNKLLKLVPASAELTLSGVYLWVFQTRSGPRYYVGRAKQLQSRLRMHLGLMEGLYPHIGTNAKHESAAVKYKSNAKLYILEVMQPTAKSALSASEKFWILYFWRVHGAQSLLNVNYTSSRPVKRNTHLYNYWNGEKGLENRETQGLRMSLIMRKKFEDPEYQERNRKDSIQRSSTPEAKEAHSHRMIRYFADPANREKQADNVRGQWKDPQFVALNSERVKKLHASGWSPSKNVIVKVSLPNGKSYLVRQKTLVTFLGAGCRSDGVLSFVKNKLFSDWVVSEKARKAGNEMKKFSELIESQEENFFNDPFINWISQVKEKLPTGKVLSRARPIRFVSDAGHFKTLFSGWFRIAGRVLHPNGKITNTYETLYQFAKDTTPIYWDNQVTGTRDRMKNTYKGS